MKVGLVGFPRAGKTTLFNAMTGLNLEVGAFDNRREPTIAVVKVPDPRVDALSEIVHPKEKKYAEVTFLDLPPSQERKAALEPQSLVQMREVDALAQVVAAFNDSMSCEPVHPARDLGAFQTELILADLGVIEKRLERLKKEKGKEREQQLLTRCQAMLEAETPLRALEVLPEESSILSGFAFLSHKPLLIVYNTDESAIHDEPPGEIREYASTQDLLVVPVCGKLEMESAQLAEEERGAFLADLGLSESASDRFIRHAYDQLKLMSFFTAGPTEVRAWTITRGTPAVRAAGKIHSDIERGFIRAEVIGYDDYIEFNGEAGCRSAGKLRLEGKDYVVQDGDVMHIRFNI
jgi:GTP-binding protein YchF